MLCQMTCKTFSDLYKNKGKKMQDQRKKFGKKVVSEYNSFPVNKATTTKIKFIGKTVDGGSIKRGC